jgi:ribosomal protein L29
MATKKQNLTEKNSVELTAMLDKQREDLRTIRFASAGGRPKDTSSARKSRRQVARILTEMHAQKLGVLKQESNAKTA